MPRQGEVHQRLDSDPPLLVVVASGAVFNTGTGMTFVCPVLTGLTEDVEYAVWLPFDVPGLDPDERVRGVVVPEGVYRVPTGALGIQPVARLPEPLVERLRATIKSIFD